MRYVGRGEGAPGCISEPFTAEMAAKKRAHMLATFRHHQNATTRNDAEVIKSPPLPQPSAEGQKESEGASQTSRPAQGSTG